MTSYPRLSAGLAAQALMSARGTVQEDILKEGQGQNTCLFSAEFSLKLMWDIQARFIDHGARHFYLVSISGFHIADAGASPITQLTLTMPSGFTYVESYLARGTDIDGFASAIETGCQRGKNQDESPHCEPGKHDGSVIDALMTVAPCAGSVKLPTRCSRWGRAISPDPLNACRRPCARRCGWPGGWWSGWQRGEKFVLMLASG